ncbi:hypothetical protein [Longimicrobium sp.]|uniref:hypothetical protein n=1 Tax=Longimicrobium sp. TaxID=2029185 RepID=UPI002E305016|nr:hypothetical protein [Longimicrobium sp.]HEX6038914.1 hypothetical protein [Longimicrobium sp.]
MAAFKSNYEKEVERWNTPRSQGGMRPDTFQAFPVMVYRARRPERGGPYLVIDPREEAWSMGNCATARNEEELDRYLRQGWQRTPGEAIEHANREDERIANEAAARAHSDRRLSEKAKGEAAEADAETADHLPEIPEKPVVRRGRKPAAA